VTAPRHHFWLIPHRERFPRRRSDWLRPVVVLLAIALLATGAVTAVPWLAKRLVCRDGLPSGAVYSSGGDCVGLSDGRYAFDVAGFDRVLGRVAELNAQAPGACGDQPRPPVTVGVLMSLTNPGSGSRALHELEGFVAAQARANQPGCHRALRLRVGHTGSAEQAAEDIARRFRADPAVVAVVGLGLSSSQAARAINALGGPPGTDGSSPVPMVSDVITAEGFDADGTQLASRCADEATLAAGVGGTYFFRVAYRNALQIDELRAFLGDRPTFVVAPDDPDDPYTCTSLQQLRTLYQQARPQVPEVRFSVTNAATVPQVAQRVCGARGAVTVFYVARSRDLGVFLASLADRYDNGRCEAESVTVASISDAVRMRVPEIDPGLEAPRRRALASAAFGSGWLRLVYTPLADVDGLRRRGQEFAMLEQQFRSAGFDVAHLDDGWGINAYDAVRTVAEAVQTLDSDKDVTRAGLRSAVAAFSAAGEGPELVGANGPIRFENNGNRVGVPAAVRLCPPDPVGRLRTVAQPADPPARPSC